MAAPPLARSRIAPVTQAIIYRKSVPSRSLSSLADELQNQQLQFDMFRLKDNVFYQKNTTLIRSLPFLILTGSSCISGSEKLRILLSAIP